MARPSRATKDKIIYDLGTAARLKQFRLEFVDPVLNEAAKKIGTSGANLSRMERGLSPVSIKTVDRLVDDYNLNIEFLSKGLGEKRLREKAKPTAASSLQAAHTELAKLSGYIEMMQARETSLWNRLDALQKRMDKLEDENSELKALLRK